MGDELGPQRLWWRRIVGRRRWPVVEGTFVDKRHLRTREFKGERTHATISYDEYLVEIPGPDGEPRRIRIQEDHIEVPEVLKRHIPRGKAVRLRVHLHPGGDKAVFAEDPTESRSERKRREEDRRARDEERFRQQGG